MNEIEELAFEIEEIRLKLKGTVGGLNEGFGMFCAKDLINKGYRKQENCFNLSYIIDEFKCSKCGYHCDDTNSYEEDDDGETFHYDFQFKFCPNCGAKVKDY